MALFKPRTDTGSPVLSAASLVPLASRKALGTAVNTVPKVKAIVSGSQKSLKPV
jgi:hypothetical protein